MSHRNTTKQRSRNLVVQNNMQITVVAEISDLLSLFVRDCRPPIIPRAGLFLYTRACLGSSGSFSSPVFLIPWRLTLFVELARLSSTLICMARTGITTREWNLPVLKAPIWIVGPRTPHCPRLSLYSSMWLPDLRSIVAYIIIITVINTFAITTTTGPMIFLSHPWSQSGGKFGKKPGRPQAYPEEIWGNLRKCLS